MTRKGVILGHEVEGVVEFFFRDFPRDECAVGEFCCKHGLADAANDAFLLHGADALDDGFQRDSRFLGDKVEGLFLEAGDEVFRNGEDLRVDGIGY